MKRVIGYVLGFLLLFSMAGCKLNIADNHVYVVNDAQDEQKAKSDLPKVNSNLSEYEQD